MKKLLAIAGIVGLLGMSTGTVFAAGPTSVIVGAQSASITVGTAASRTFSITAPGAGNKTVTWSVSGLPTGVTGSFSPNPVTANGSWPTTLTVNTTATTSAGSYIFTVSNDTSSVTATGTLVVGSTLTAQTITVNTHAPASAANHSSFTVAATASSGLTVAVTVTGGVCSIVGNTVTMTASSGTCVVHYNQAGDSTYAAAPEVTESVTANTPANNPPVATAQSVSATEDTVKAITLAGTDADNDPITFATSTNPLHGTLSGFNTSTGAVTYTPDINYNGTDSFDFRVNDGTVNSATATVSITVDSVNDAPSFSVSSSSIVVDEDSGAFTLSNWATSIFTGAANEASQIVDFIIGFGSTNLFAVNPAVSALGTLTFTPAANANGSVTVTAKIHDNGGTANGGVDTSASSTFVITVTPVNDAPVITTIGDKTVDENVNLAFTVVATDVDLDTLTYSASNLPTGATFDTGTHNFSWTPDYTQAGTYPGIVFSVFDGTATTSETISITVNNINRAPTLATIGNKTVDENSTLAFQISGTDPDGDSVSYTATGLPTGATFDTNSGEFSWTPDYTQAGNYSVTFGSTDGSLSTTEVVPIDVGNVNRAPNLSAIGNISFDELTPINLTASASDPDGDAVTYALTGDIATAGATIDANTGVVTWTPAENQDGTYSATVTATDNGSSTLSDSETFTVTVNEVNAAPVSQDKTLTTDEDTSATTTLTATDSDIPTQSISYIILTQPAHGTVALTGDKAVFTPDANWFGTTSYEYAANDGVELSSTSTVTVTVNSVNDIPVLTVNNNSMLYTPQNGTFTMPTLIANDIEDGDISALATTTGTVDTSNIGDYTLTSSVTDSDGATASQSQVFHVYGYAGGGGSANGIVGCMDPKATNFNPLATYPNSCSYGVVLGASTTTIPETGGQTTNVTETSTTTPTVGEVLGATAYNFTRNLHYGDVGDDVTELQKILIGEGFLKITTPTKWFGPLTQAALKSWQKTHNIPATGLFGALSRAFLTNSQ